VATDRSLRPRSGSSAKALLLTVLGEFTLPAGGVLWTSTAVRALATLDVEERNARQALARLADQGVVASERHGQKARWRLTADGRRLLTTGTDRIYDFGRDAEVWDGRWLVVNCAVPEEQRAKRLQLRTQLEFAGFGFLAPSVALTPHTEREREANAILDALDLSGSALVIRGELGDAVDPHELLRRAWDLDALADGYAEFMAAFADRAPTTDVGRFAALVELVHAWRRFPFVDPEIPARLLPQRWPGKRARRLFDARHRAWSPGAQRWYAARESATDS
jgi:phenylacetic acid degradation operon negative regulatory protein